MSPNAWPVRLIAVTVLLMSAPSTRAATPEAPPEEDGAGRACTTWFGADTLFTLRYRDEQILFSTWQSSVETLFTIGPSLSYFFLDEAHLDVQLSYLVRYRDRTTTTGDIETSREWVGLAGFLGLGMGFHAELTDRLYFVPGFGGGAFVGTQSEPDGGGSQQNLLTGGALNVGLDLVFYPGERDAHIRFGLDLMVVMGSIEPSEEWDDARFFMEVLVGLSFGFKYEV